MNSQTWTVANLLTASRIPLIFPLVYLIRSGSFGGALAVFLIAAITDLADGYVARRYQQQSSFGRILDPIADKLLTTAAFVALAVPPVGVPAMAWWIAAAVVLRDVLILAGSLTIYLVTGFTGFKPSFIGKCNTVLELVLIALFLFVHSIDEGVWVLPGFYLMVLLSIIVSGGGYIMQGMRIVGDHRSRRKPEPVEQTLTKEL